jgi:hypothetical protein
MRPHSSLSVLSIERSSYQFYHLFGDPPYLGDPFPAFTDFLPAPNCDPDLLLAVTPALLPKLMVAIFKIEVKTSFIYF